MTGDLTDINAESPASTIPRFCRNDTIDVTT